ncbi:GntR family transcriptional regulator [Humitalea sp. 24SJ18S-53]|uniref:GntR family transcriptional regulator n=1 Tax=Humitalea sp. 24SJ18S-53 TaxID=3422307 RepID=UPI003D67682B
MTTPKDVPVPLYHRVYVVLRQQLAEGTWDTGLAMPSEHELARSFNVSRITIRRALDRLQAEGLISRRRGSGTFAEADADQPQIRHDLTELFADLVAMGLKTPVTVLDFAYLPAPPKIATALETPRGTMVQKSVRVRHYKDRPFSHLTAWVPEEVGRGFERADLTRRPLLRLLEDAGCVIARAEQAISAKLANDAVAAALDVPVGSALLYVRRQVRDQHGRVVEYLQALYQPDLYEYQMGMRWVQRSGRSMWSTESDAAD